MGVPERWHDDKGEIGDLDTPQKWWRHLWTAPSAEDDDGDDDDNYAGNDEDENDSDDGDHTSSWCWSVSCWEVSNQVRFTNVQVVCYTYCAFRLSKTFT